MSNTPPILSLCFCSSSQEASSHANCRLVPNRKQGGVGRIEGQGLARPTGDGLGQNTMAQRPYRIIDRRPGRRLYPQPTEAPVPPALAPPASGSIISDIFVPTAEQRAILHARFDHGDIVKIEAVAGSGKTSVLRTLVHTHANRGRVLYLVFSKALQVTESQYMTGADMHGTVSVATLDSLAWQHTQQCHGGRVVPVLGLSAEDVRFEPPAFAKVVSKTIERFAQSVDECITTAHVPGRRPPGRPATGSARTQWPGDPTASLTSGLVAACCTHN
jgi:hypothetical protein